MPQKLAAGLFHWLKKSSPLVPVAVVMSKKPALTNLKACLSFFVATRLYISAPGLDFTTSF